MEDDDEKTMKTYRIPLMILAALLVLATGAVTASAVHYVAVRSGASGPGIQASIEAPLVPSAAQSDPGCAGPSLRTEADERA